MEMEVREIELRLFLHAAKVGQRDGQALHFRVARQERLHPGERHGVDLGEQARVFRLREVEPGVENGRRFPTRVPGELDLPEAFAKAVVREAEIEPSRKIVMNFVSVEFPLDERDPCEGFRSPGGLRRTRDEEAKIDSGKLQPGLRGKQANGVRPARKARQLD